MILEQIYCIRYFGVMSGRFNFSNFQQPTEGQVNRKKRSESTFSALTSIIHVQGLHSHYQQLPSYTHKHTLPAFILLWDHTQLCPAPALPISQPLLWEAWMPPLNQSSVKGVLLPWSTKLGLVFFSVFFKSFLLTSCCRQSLPFCERTSEPGMWSGHLWTKEHSMFLLPLSLWCVFSIPARFPKSVSSWGHIHLGLALFLFVSEVSRHRDAVSVYWSGSSRQNVISSPLASKTFCCAISLMRWLLRNGCLLAAVIFIPSSLSNGTAALVIPLNSSGCKEEKAANGKDLVLQANLSYLLSLTFLCCFHTPWEPSIIPSQDCLLQGTASLWMASCFIPRGTKSFPLSQA